MKIRTGFVSNSSSSSFICAVSGEVMAGMDMGLSDFDMSECENGHEFFNQYLVEENSEEVKIDYAKKRLKYFVENYPPANDSVELLSQFNTMSASDWLEVCEDEEVFEEYEYETPAHLCPICTLTFLRDKDTLKYILEKLGLEKDSIEDEIRSKHSDLSGLKGK